MVLPRLDNTTTAPDTCPDAGATRTAFEIFSTCASTMFVCVWSALHIEVPTRPRGVLGGFAYRVRWMLMGVFMPPWLLYLAAAQLINAVRLLDVVYCDLGRNALPPPGGWVYRKVFLKRYFRKTDEEYPLNPSSEEDTNGNGDEASCSVRVHPWTLTHAFFAIMGGYVIDTSEATTTEHRGRYVLTPRGVAWLLQHTPELIPDVSEEIIQDRSKADTLVKLISLSQVLYFCGSCIERGIKGLPLSLLEVVTLAHAFCTVVTYVVWLKKPLSIMEPTVISGNSALMKKAAAFLLAHTPDKDLRPPKPSRPRSKISMLQEAQRLQRQRPRPRSPSPDGELYASADALAAFRRFPFLARDSGLAAASLADAYNRMELTGWRAGALSACMALYALPLLVWWGPASAPGDPDLGGLWHGATVGLLATGALQAMVLTRILQQSCFARLRVDDCTYVVAYVYGLVSVVSLLGYGVCVSVAMFMGLLQLKDLPASVLQRTPTFKYWPHIS